MKKLGDRHSAVTLFNSSGTMHPNELIAALQSIAHPTRLQIIEILHSAKDGLEAGKVAARLGVRKNTLSSHMSKLDHAGLVYGRREGRNIFYSVDATALEKLASNISARLTQSLPGKQKTK